MRYGILLLLIFVSAPSFGQSANLSVDQIWEVGDQRWTAEEERRFEKWVDETITDDFFIRYRIPADCADVVYAIRWIYARMVHLPAAATTTDGKLIGHWSTDWKHLPTHPEWYRDERFRAALLYVLRKTWTGTLPLDTYPIGISPNSVTPGTLFLIRESHAGIIGHVSLDGSQAHPLQTWESELPVKVQKLNPGYFFSPKPEAKARSGLLKFRWPVFENGEWKYLPVEKHPFYSEEQYAPGFSDGSADFIEAVSRRIDPVTYSPSEKVTRVLETITRLLRERVSMVQEGYKACHHGGCPEGSEMWEVYNTRGRDGMLLSLMDHLSRIVQSNRLDHEKVKGVMQAIPITITKDRSVTVDDLTQNCLWFSPHPEDSIEARWGLKKCEMIRTQTRTTRNSIAFIERTYRKKDPKYADFSIQQQQLHLRRLEQEQTRSECENVSPAPEKIRPLFPVAQSSKTGAGWKTCERIRAEIHATSDSIAFIEKRYRDKDPEYANFSIQQQQQDLERLNEAWIGSECAQSLSKPERKARKRN